MTRRSVLDWRVVQVNICIRTLRNPEEGEYFWLLLDLIKPGITSRFDGPLTGP